ncbi:hypothetical protein CRUP_034033 [Coryphaenoides rupestris]|nr:hypothetical protein CRUP_034033 [Coryphaenoides rupestris]
MAVDDQEWQAAQDTLARLHCKLFAKMGDDRPFVCAAPGCGQSFTNEDHLSVHKHKHEMTLKFGPARTDSVIIADQTPTPTRFLKNCEEVGLFNELASSFEHEFRKAQEDDDKRSKNPDTPPRSSAPTPTIVRPGSLPLHLGSPTSHYPMMMLPNGHAVPVLPGPVQMHSVINLARPVCMVPNIPGIPGPPLGGSSSGSSSPSGYSIHSEAKMRLKATLSQHSPSGLGLGAVMGIGCSPMVPQKAEQSQLLVQHPDAPSPAQPQVSPAQPTGGRRRRTAEDDPDERRQRFLERNRAAASRCRQKRKVWVCSLEKKAEELNSLNVSLSNEVSLLRNEVAHLKQLLLAHKDCPVTNMQKKSAYLAPVIQHSSLAPSPSAGPNGLSARAAAEAMAMSVLAGMGQQRQHLLHHHQQHHHHHHHHQRAESGASQVIMAVQSHSNAR